VGIRLSRDKAWEELSRAHTGILTSLKADGTPITLPIWFVALDRRVYFSAPARTGKVARLRRNARCCFLVESGTYWREMKAVLVTGQALEVGDGEARRRARQALDAKYDAFRIKHADMPDPTRATYEREEPVMFGIVSDERILTWLSGTHAFIAWADYRPGDRSGFLSSIPLSAFKHG
jgi:nitroimidazol reductase NimA-like FMN-containing flavoprotein (pyridoxamine 5'-phosphate oxidase superfamily)